MFDENNWKAGQLDEQLGLIVEQVFTYNEHVFTFTKFRVSVTHMTLLTNYFLTNCFNDD